MSNVLARLDFGNEAADDVDPEELAKYFVEQEAFGKFLELRHKLLVATARKGVGKSALLQWILHRCRRRRLYFCLGTGYYNNSYEYENRAYTDSCDESFSWIGGRREECLH